MDVFTNTPEKREYFDKFVEAQDVRIKNKAQQGILKFQGVKHMEKKIKIGTMPYPLDLINHKIWSRKETGAIKGPVYTVDFSEKPNKKATIDLMVLLEKNVRLTPIQKRIMIAVGALWDAGYHEVNAVDVWRLIGYRGNTATERTEDQMREISEMASIIFSINNADEVTKGLRYPEFQYMGSILPVKINAETMTIQITGEPPLIRFAKERGEIAAIPSGIFKTNIKLTRRSVAAENYLIERIYGKANNEKIYIATVWENARDAKPTRSTKWIEAKQQYEKLIYDILDNYKTMGIIADYRICSRGTKDAAVQVFREAVPELLVKEPEPSKETPMEAQPKETPEAPKEMPEDTWMLLLNVPLELAKFIKSQAKAIRITPEEMALSMLTQYSREAYKKIREMFKNE